MADRWNESSAAHVDFEDADGPGVFADNANCTWCSGEGEFWGSELPGYDPGWYKTEESRDKWAEKYRARGDRVETEGVMIRA